MLRLEPQDPETLWDFLGPRECQERLRLLQDGIRRLALQANNVHQLPEQYAAQLDDLLMEALRLQRIASLAHQAGDSTMLGVVLSTRLLTAHLWNLHKRWEHSQPPVT